eukprot:6185075-Pleurochrysis_carterae.AAC.5
MRSASWTIYFVTQLLNRPTARGVVPHHPRTRNIRVYTTPNKQHGSWHKQGQGQGATVYVIFMARTLVLRQRLSVTRWMKGYHVPLNIQYAVGAQEAPKTGFKIFPSQVCRLIEVHAVPSAINTHHEVHANDSFERRLLLLRSSRNIRDYGPSSCGRILLHSDQAIC